MCGQGARCFVVALHFAQLTELLREIAPNASWHFGSFREVRGAALMACPGDGSMDSFGEAYGQGLDRN